MTHIDTYNLKINKRFKEFVNTVSKLDYYAVLIKGGMTTELRVTGKNNINSHVIKTVKMWPHNSANIRHKVYKLSEAEYTIAMMRFI